MFVLAVIKRYRNDEHHNYETASKHVKPCVILGTHVFACASYQAFIITYNLCLFTRLSHVIIFTVKEQTSASIFNMSNIVLSQVLI